MKSFQEQRSSSSDKHPELQELRENFQVALRPWSPPDLKSFPGRPLGESSSSNGWPRLFHRRGSGSSSSTRRTEDERIVPKPMDSKNAP